MMTNMKTVLFTDEYHAWTWLRKKIIFFSCAKRKLSSYDLIEFVTNEQYMSVDSLVFQAHERG